MKYLNKLIALGCLLGCAAFSHAEAVVTADIKSIRVLDSGVILKIDHGGNCSGCVAGGHFISFSGSSSDAAKGMLSVALSAKATKQPITIYTDWVKQCVSNECLGVVNSVEIK